ncbi:hypothetical protein BB560_003006, partial [Smittium megazygosporum]
SRLALRSDSYFLVKLIHRISSQLKTEPPSETSGINNQEEWKSSSCAVYSSPLVQQMVLLLGLSTYSNAQLIPPTQTDTLPTTSILPFSSSTDNGLKSDSITESPTPTTSTTTRDPTTSTTSTSEPPPPSTTTSSTRTSATSTTSSTTSNNPTTTPTSTPTTSDSPTFTPTTTHAPTDNTLSTPSSTSTHTGTGSSSSSTKGSNSNLGSSAEKGGLSTGAKASEKIIDYSEFPEYDPSNIAVTDHTYAQERMNQPNARADANAVFLRELDEA